MERFQRAAEAKGRILKAERLDPGGAGEAQRAVAFLVTFDVGRLLVSVDPDSGEITSHFVEPGSEAPAGLVDAVEDEPWWRVLGSPLVRVWFGDATQGGRRSVRLQFREDDENPKIVALDADGPLLQAALAEAEPPRHTA
jgi:hypothetical protein